MSAIDTADSPSLLQQQLLMEPSSEGPETAFWQSKFSPIEQRISQLFLAGASNSFERSPNLADDGLLNRAIEQISPEHLHSVFKKCFEQTEVRWDQKSIDRLFECLLQHISIENLKKAFCGSNLTYTDVIALAR